MKHHVEYSSSFLQDVREQVEFEQIHHGQEAA